MSNKQYVLVVLGYALIVLLAVLLLTLYPDVLSTGL